MKMDEMHNMNISRSNLMKTSGPNETPKKTSRVETTTSSLDEVAATASRGLLALALQVQGPEAPRTSRVEELRKQIQSGQYVLDMPEVSRAIVDGSLNRD